MADHAIAQDTDSDALRALTEDRFRMWNGFTNATVGAVVFVVALLIGMAIFLL